MSWITDTGDDAYEEYDESSIRMRPNPKANKPRTKQRPQHNDSVTGRVISVDRGRYGVIVAEATDEEHRAIATRARELGRKSIVTGDFVDLVGDTSGVDGSLSRIDSLPADAFPASPVGPVPSAPAG